MQSLWSKHLDWDDNLPSDDVILWDTIRQELAKIPNVAIPRCIAQVGCEKSSYKLFCFCDASAKAYAVAIYLHQTGVNESRCDLIFAKSRLAPTKQMSIPRLELMAVVIGVRCIKFVKDNLNLPVDHIHLWTDSQCVLHWITSENVSSVFVANRVKEIKRQSSISFHHIPSSENPADIATRGASVHQLKELTLWWHGPEWLTQQGYNWQIEPSSEKDLDEDLIRKSEEDKKLHKKQSAEHVLEGAENSDKKLKGASPDGAYTQTELPPFEIESEKYSSATKLVRVTAFALRFISKLRNKSTERGVLTKQELDRAEHLWITYVQQKCFRDTFVAISEQKPNNLQRQLGLYVDPNGLLRCRGRLENANLIEAARYPILLPKGERLTHMMIDKMHKETLHSGVSQTLSRVRFRFWIPSGRTTIKGVIRRCLVCRRNEGGAYKMPPMAPLPMSRVTESSPFSKVGLDYLGPLYIKGADGTSKVWICLFTCLVTRAIHLELVQNMSTEQFLMCLRRFIASRGKPEVVFSDNALQFKLASETVDIIWKNIMKTEDVQDYASQNGIHWIFNIELAPWMGGFYERLVGLVKRSLRKTIGRNLLTEMQMQTLIKEIESVINTRPLTYVGDDVNSMITLTPSSFLTLNPKIGIPSVDIDSDTDYTPYESSAQKLLQIWKKGQKLLNSFWKMWREEYLLSLRERTQTKLKSHRIQSHFLPRVGDVVLIKDDVPRGCWKFGKIKDLIKSCDGQTRSAKVQTHTGRVIGRPLNLLYPIEVSGNVDARHDSYTPESSDRCSRPKRPAAEQAKVKLSEYFNKDN
ncbi:uncharacterized protein LOC128222416 [Mya arenaria]|uniref:uncharacterized protein LOC128222416 n=1 Tax=Mya arenaria TaxID=6604 RepID=UPI0022E955C7|nr:uncharacterized protein LOC128222416 [Mya arenaria]